MDFFTVRDTFIPNCDLNTIKTYFNKEPKLCSESVSQLIGLALYQKKYYYHSYNKFIYS